MRRLSVPLLVVALLAVPASAGAATFRGSTSQGRKANLSVDAKGPKRLYLSYRAKCDGRSFARFTAKVWFIRPMRSVSARSFTDGGDTVYRQKGGIRSTATTEVTGSTDRGSSGWDGTFSATVVVRKGKRVLDRCRVGKILWSADARG